MREKCSALLISFVITAIPCVQAGAQTSPPQTRPSMPYAPSLDVSSMDKSVDPCVDLYQYSCGGWKKNNPDDEGSQFDGKGNLKNWWTKEDRAKFDARTKCVQDQYAQYVVIDDVHINSALTLGEDVADLGGEILAFMAWKNATKGQELKTLDGLIPEQRFFVGFASQWACENDRPEQLRVRALTDPHSPGEYRVNGVVLNIPEFSQAFSSKEGQPMVKSTDKICQVW